MDGEGTPGRGDADGRPWVDFSLFPGQVAVADPAPVGSAVSAELSCWDARPSSVELRYRVAGRLVLLVRTVRRPDDGPHRGVLVEDLASAVTGFQLGTAARTHEGGPLTGERGARPPGAAARAAVAEASHREVSIELDSVPAQAVRVDVPGCAAVEVPGGSHTILCAGTPPTIDTLRLATRSPEEINSWRDALS